MIFLHNSQMKTAEILSFSSFLDLCQECRSRYTLNRTNPSLYWNSYEYLDNPFMLLSKREILWSRTLKPGNRGLAGLSHSPSLWTLFPHQLTVLPVPARLRNPGLAIAEPGSCNCATLVWQKFLHWGEGLWGWWIRSGCVCLFIAFPLEWVKVFYCARVIYNNV